MMKLALGLFAPLTMLAVADGLPWRQVNFADGDTEIGRAHV